MLTLSQFYESIFGCKTYKISLDAACTCPNRDGSKGKGGCIFCSQAGSGDFVAGRSFPIKEQIEQGKKLVEVKLRGRSGERQSKYIAYFQSFTSTYGDAENLLSKYREALNCEGVEGLAVATRPDCLSDEILKGLADISREHFVQIELGLQTCNEATGNLINRCYTNEDYLDAVSRIRKAAPSIHIVTHLIFGLPGETEEDMLKSVKFVVEQNTRHAELVSASNTMESDLHQNDKWGIKITSLYILKNTRLATMYEDGAYQPLTKDQYFALLQKALQLLPQNCVVHRLTGDPPKSQLLAPQWTTDKKRILNEIKNLLFLI
ncbi:TIGR01212 family radical SAM protein [Treponema bryantii]|uniref:TIGR01212 family radical SAM protein n=1 Tax=Treponema bryantii TaxID=163 RepID=UPI0003B6F58E|nr:TIGR01212 family radical SAM protein [Treponema bryantii]